MAPKGSLFAFTLMLWVHLTCADTETTTAPAPPAPPTTNPTAAPTPTLSGCQICAAVGDCTHAYLDGPGQFCGNWLDQLNQRQRCCCPRDAVCKVSNYACKCSYRSTPSPRSPAATSAPRTRSSSSGGLGGGLVVTLGLVVTCCVGAVCCCCVRRSGASQPTRLFFGATGPMVTYDVLPARKYGGDVVYAQPAPAVYQPNPYAMAPAYHPGVYPSGPAYGYGGYGHSSGGGSGSALAAGGLGAVAGLATGMVVANSFGHHTSTHHYSGGGCEGGYSSGGGDYGGDSGGDFGGDF